MSRMFSAVLAGVMSAATCAADVRLPAIFGNNMVVQQQTDAVIWGWARPGEKVQAKGSWGGQSLVTVADENGRFRVTIPTGEAGGPHTLTVSGDNTIVLENVLLGEVWLCSGQSNMEWPLAATENAEAAIAAANHPAIRLFTVENTISAHPRLDVNGSWSACSPEVARNFSAVGYYFALALREKLGDVPIGLIAADWGGTPAEAWMSPAALARSASSPMRSTSSTRSAKTPARTGDPHSPRSVVEQPRPRQPHRPAVEHDRLRRLQVDPCRIAQHLGRSGRRTRRLRWRGLLPARARCARRDCRGRRGAGTRPDRRL